MIYDQGRLSLMYFVFLLITFAYVVRASLPDNSVASLDIQTLYSDETAFDEIILNTNTNGTATKRSQLLCDENLDTDIDFLTGQLDEVGAQSLYTPTMTSPKQPYSYLRKLVNRLVIKKDRVPRTLSKFALRQAVVEVMVLLAQRAEMSIINWHDLNHKFILTTASILRLRRYNVEKTEFSAILKIFYDDSMHGLLSKLTEYQRADLVLKWMIVLLTHIPGQRQLLGSIEYNAATRSVTI